MSDFFKDIFAARLLHNLKTSNVDCSKHIRQSKGLKCICWKCYTYVSIEKNQEDKLRRSLLLFLINYFYKILSSNNKVITDEMISKLKKFTQNLEYEIYKNNQLLESYMHYFDYQFLKIILPQYQVLNFIM